MSSRAREPKKSRRPETADGAQQLVLRLAREDNWGGTRIVGELRGLGAAQSAAGLESHGETLPGTGCTLPDLGLIWA